MAKIFVFTKKENLADSVQCGLKLSENFSRIAEIYGEEKKCIVGYLNPNDYNADAQTEGCLLCDVADKYCFIHDASLLNANSKPYDKKLYLKSIVPYEKYELGKYRQPEVLVTSTILGDFINLQEKRLDVPMLYENSEKLYLEICFEKLEQKSETFKEDVIGLMFEKLCESGEVEKYNGEDDGIIYVDKISGECFCVKHNNLLRYIGSEQE